MASLAKLYYRVRGADHADAARAIRDATWVCGRLAATGQLSLDLAARHLLDAAKRSVGVGLATILVAEGLRGGITAHAGEAGR
jgi:hypothetical protein